MTPPSSADVAIIGGGVIGVACALELAKRGARVVVLERDRIGHGCSFGNAGWLTPSQAVPLANPNLLLKSFRWMLDPESPLYIQPRLDPSYLRWLAGFLLSARKAKFERGAAALVELCRASVDRWEAFARTSTIPFGFERHGLLAVYESARSLDAARGAIDLVARSGVHAERWSADDIRQREPAIVGAQVGGYFFKDDAHCEPYAAVRALAIEAEQAGVTFVEGADVFAVHAIASPGGRRVVTTRGDVLAERVVLAAGAWSEPFGKILGLRSSARSPSIRMPTRSALPARSSSCVTTSRSISDGST